MRLARALPTSRNLGVWTACVCLSTAARRLCHGAFSDMVSQLFGSGCAAAPDWAAFFRSSRIFFSIESTNVPLNVEGESIAPRKIVGGGWDW